MVILKSTDADQGTGNQSLMDERSGSFIISTDEEIKKLLNQMYGADLDLTTLTANRNSLTFNSTICNENEYIDSIGPYMKFASRKSESKMLLGMVETQLSTDFSTIPEATRSVSIPTITGAPGKGKTTFCRNLSNINVLNEFSNDFQAIVSNCISSGRRFRVAYLRPSV